MSNVPAATHALRILKLLSLRAEPMPAAAIARHLELPRSSVYHLLTALAEQGFVAHLPEERRWGLGVAAFELGSAYTRSAPLQHAATPLLARLVDRTTFTGHLAVLHGKDVLYLVEERAPRRPSLVTDVGVRLPATVTASGMALLSKLPPAQVRALFPSAADFVTRGGDAPMTPTMLRRELTAVRQRGYALESNTVTHGFGSVAIAAVDHTGLPAAGIAVTFPESEVDGPQLDQLVSEVRRAARDLSRRLRARAGQLPADGPDDDATPPNPPDPGTSPTRSH